MVFIGPSCKPGAWKDDYPAAGEFLAGSLIPWKVIFLVLTQSFLGG